MSRTTVKELEAKVVELEQQVTERELEARVAELEARLSTLSTVVAEHEGGVQGLKDRMDKASTYVGALAKSVKFQMPVRRVKPTTKVVKIESKMK
jgi:uncharacterized coiled-coil protein SlyX